MFVNLSHNIRNRPPFAYLRVSTLEQKEKGVSIESMKISIEALVKSQNITIPKSGWYKDEGISGEKTRNRPEMIRLIRDVETGKYDKGILFVKDQERLTRHASHFRLLMDLFKRHGIIIYYLTEGFHDPSALNQLTVRLKAEIAEDERLRASIRTYSALKPLARHRRVGGRVPFGYFLEQTSSVDHRGIRLTRLAPNPAEAAIIQHVFELFLQYRCYSQVARILNRDGTIPPQRRYRGKKSRKQWNYKTLSHILKNPVYIGQQIWGKKSKRQKRVVDPSEWVICENAHDQIVSEEMFAAAQKIIQERYYERKSRKTRIRSIVELLDEIE